MVQIEDRNPNQLHALETLPTVEWVNPEAYSQLQEMSNGLLAQGRVEVGEGGDAYKYFAKDSSDGRLAATATGEGNVRVVAEYKDGRSDENGYPTYRTLTFGFNRNVPDVLNYGADGWLYARRGSILNSQLPKGVTVAPDKDVIGAEFAWFMKAVPELASDKSDRRVGSARRFARFAIGRFMGDQI